MIQGLQATCQDQSRAAHGTHRGFTIVEVLTVITMIAILATALFHTVTKARAMARQTECKSNLRQFGAAILVYRADNGNRNPDWLSCLYPQYVDDKHLFVCRSDAAKGVGRNRPAGLHPYTGVDPDSAQSFEETIDNQSNKARPGNRQNADITTCSYFYEFSCAPKPADWSVWSGAPAVVSWNLYKEHQLQFGDLNSDPNNSSGGPYRPYSSSRMPIIRCYHHFAESHVRAHDNDKSSHVIWGQTITRPITINVAYAGNVYVGPLLWEAALQPGER